MPRAEAGGLRCRRLAVGRLADAAADSDAIYGNQGASIGGAGCIAFTEWFGYGRVMWTINSQLLIGEATGLTDDLMYQWWVNEYGV